MRIPHGSRLAAIPRHRKEVQQPLLVRRCCNIVFQGSLKGESYLTPRGASQAREFSLFPAVTASQAMEFSLFPPLQALQAAEFQIARQRRLDSPPNPVFFECVSMFLQWFPSKHGTLHFCRHKTGRKHHVRQCFQLGFPS